MKKRFLVIAALIGLLVSCRNPAEGSPDDPDNPVNPKQETVIVFDNTQGICAAVVYNDGQRRDEDKIAEIPAGARSPEIEWTPGTSVAFYFTYRISLKGINGFTLNYVPVSPGDRTTVPINANAKTNVVIPKLAETLSLPDALLSNNSYLLIQNNSSYSFQLLRGDGILQPDNLSNSLVISGERAQYTVDPGVTSPYRLRVQADDIPFPGSLASFEAGRVYSFIFSNGALSLASEVELTLENVAGGSANKPVPEAPAAPAVIASDGLLTVRWTAVEGAESYEVYRSTGQNPPALPERTVYSTTTVLTGLTNKTAYYVWVKAVNENGASGFSPRARGIPWSANEVPATPERPVITDGIYQLTVNWEECGGASSYEVYVNTTTTTPSAAAVTTDKTSTVIANLENDVIYYIWVRAINSAGKSGYSPAEAGTPRVPTAAPAAPPRPALSAGNHELTVSWQAVALAATYEVWYGTSDDSAQAQKFGGDISGGVTETVITGLTNETTYYVWVKAKNVVGASGFSLPANAKLPAFLPETPTAPTVISGNGELSVSWPPVEDALSYEVWTGTTDNSAYAVKHGADISGTSLTLTGLDDWTTYYVWLKAKNNAGTSEFGPAASGISLDTSGLSAGLYCNGGKIDNHQNLSAAMSYISANAVSGDNYFIVLEADESAYPMDLYYSGRTVRIALIGLGGERKITLASNGNLFTINSGVTLIIDKNISLIGRNPNNVSLVRVDSNGTVIMNGGTISESTVVSSGGGVYVKGGTFTMYGGTISKSTGSSGGGIYIDSGTVVMNGGTINGNASTDFYGSGGGIYVSNGTVTINGGTISGNTTRGSGGGIYVSAGTVIMNGGTISGNTAPSSGGGGIFVSAGTVIMNGGTISENRSTAGGGVDVYDDGTFTMYGGTISGNTASSSGGGVYNYKTFTMYGGTISGNTASSGGGGVYVVGGTVTMYGGTISGNTAPSSGGGGIFVGGTVIMNGGTISGNTASSGGGVYVNGNGGGTFKKLPSGGGQNSGIIYGSEETGVDAGGVLLKNTANGHAVYYSSSRRRDTTAGQTDHIDTTTGRGLSADGNPPYGE